MNKQVAAILAALLLIGTVLSLRSCGRPSADVPPVPVPTSTASVVVIPAVSSAPAAVPAPKPKPVPVPSAPPSKTAELAPPAVELHTELIPKDIEIVRVYYERPITGPDSEIGFDINGSGFNEEFEKMIQVESGLAGVTVERLSLITANQIHGSLRVGKGAKTSLAYPVVRIGGKPVFQAPEPFAVIRPGEVLNLQFTEMGQSGRTGRFRVFTNLTPDMFETFRVEASTTSIFMGDLKPSLPFVVEGRIEIGPAVVGNYGIDVFRGEKKIWNRDGIIRVVEPNLGQTGLVQSARAIDGYHRPGDDILIALFGSGFVPQHTERLAVRSARFDLRQSTLAFVSPVRLDLRIRLPEGLAPGSYPLTLLSGETVLLEIPKAFEIVEAPWLRGIRLEAALQPGGETILILDGRALDDEFVSSLKVELDDPNLSVGAFRWVSPERAEATIKAAEAIKPGDYLLKLSAGGQAVEARFGSIVRVDAPAKP